MSLTLSNIVTSVNKKIHNAKAKLGGDTELYRVINEAGRELQNEVDLLSLKRRSNPFIVYDKVYEYAAPTDISFDKSIEFIDERDMTLHFEACFPADFFENRNPSSPQFPSDVMTFENPLGKRRDGVYSVEYEDGNPYLLMRTSTLAGLSTNVVNNCDGYDSNGTWVAADDATNVRTDNQRYKEGSGATAFDSSGGAVAVTVANSTMTAVDLSAMTGKGRGFLWVYLPAVCASITLRWGSDSSNYYSSTITERHSGLALRVGWNLVSFDWATATTVGSPVTTAIAYTLVTITNSVATASLGYRIDLLMFGLGREISAKYYSLFMCRTDAGVRKELFSAADDISNLRQVEDDLLILKASVRALTELREFNESKELLEKHYMPAAMLYQKKNPSQKEPRSTTYYNC